MYSLLTGHQASAAALTPNQDSDITVTPNVDVDLDVDTTESSTLDRRLIPWGNIAGVPIANLDKDGDIPAQIHAWKAAHDGGKDRRSEDAEADEPEEYDDPEEYYDSDIVLTERDLEEQYNNATELEGRDLQERAPFDYNNVYCNVKWPECSLSQARARRTSVFPNGKGRPHIEGGPGKCSRIACAYNAAIVWCNDVSLATVLFY